MIAHRFLSRVGWFDKGMSFFLSNFGKSCTETRPEPPFQTPSPRYTAPPPPFSFSEMGQSTGKSFWSIFEPRQRSLKPSETAVDNVTGFFSFSLSLSFRPNDAISLPSWPLPRPWAVAPVFLCVLFRPTSGGVFSVESNVVGFSRNVGRKQKKAGDRDPRRHRCENP